jgi:hypothetical protein
VANTAGTFVTNSVAGDLIIQPQINTKTFWVGVNASQYLSASVTATTIYPTTTSSSYTTGALVVNGGVGVAGACYYNSTLNIAGVTTITNATVASSTSTGALVVTGGHAVGGALYVGGVVHATSGTAASSSTTGALVVTGGVGISGACYFGGASFWPTTGGTATGLSYYEEASVSFTLSGPWTASQTMTSYFVRIGSNITWSWAPISSAGHTATTITSSTAIPTRFFPVNLKYFPILGLSNATIVNGVMTLSAAGAFIFYAGVGTTLANWSNTGTDTVYGGSVSWNILG